MVSWTRAIAMLLALAIMLAGPVSALAGALGECCCSSADKTALASDLASEAPASACCSSEASQPLHEQDGEPAPDRDHQDCDCTMPCCTAGKTMPLARAMTGLSLPDTQPEEFDVAEPQSHAVEAHFSLLRPPRI